jgi:parvulin-like peptidyl-prolyl isomerase
LIVVDQDATAEQREAARQKADSLRQRVQAGEDFSQLARENTDDEGTRETGGELLWLTRGQTLPAFETAAFALQAGELSEVVESPIGYHLIKLLERTEEREITFEEASPRIEQFLQQQEYQKGLRELAEKLKAKAEVEIFL